MSSGIIGFDHALVGVRDLEAARSAWQRLGFTVSPRGRHIGWGTANYCLMLADDYIELLGIVDPAQFTNNLDRFLAAREGLRGLAFASADAAATARALQERGIDGRSQDLRRILELATGAVQPAFKLVHLPAEATPGVPSFVCQHLSRSLVWQAGWSEHRNGARRLVSVTGVVEDPGAAAPAYARLFGVAAVRGDGEGLEVDTGRGRLRLLAATALDRLFPEILPPRPAAPWLAGLCVGVADLRQTARCLEQLRVPYRAVGVGRLRIAPDFATGVVLEFAADQATG